MVKQRTTSKGRSKLYSTEFDSLNQAVKHYKASKTTLMFSRDPASQRVDTGRNPWAGTKTFDEALELLNSGWTEGSKKLTTQLRIANKTQQREVKRSVYDVVGFQASVPRYLQGIPTNMINQKPMKRKQKIINLYKSICYPSSVKPDQILNDSVKTVQILQELEKQGFRVNMFAIFHSNVTGEEIFYKFKVKSASERLNLSKISFPLMHPSFLRRLIFRLMEVDDRLTGNWNPGYGRPGNQRKTEKIVQENDKHGYFIPSSISEQEALDKLKQVTDSEK